MAKLERETQTLSASEVRQQWSDVLNQVHKDKARIIVERSGIPVAVLVPLRDLERLKRDDVELGKAWTVIEDFASAFKDEDPEELEREVLKALVEVREEMRRERESLVNAA